MTACDAFFLISDGLLAESGFFSMTNNFVENKEMRSPPVTGRHGDHDDVGRQSGPRGPQRAAAADGRVCRNGDDCGTAHE